MAKNAIDLLKEDHEKVRKLLKELTETTARAEKTREELLLKIEKELQVHTTIEEEIFYPAFKDAGNSDHAKMYHEAREEHRAVEALVLPDLKKTEPKSEKFSGRAKVLKELVEHHADEEESEMFPEAKRSMSKQQLEELGARMAERKQALMKAK
ncbi:MAG TPA: hemerythrin domain-containing protein [Woeseiaceae bacterium]|nr:hemerythrin domain-containing protein [Woeseiaceae bacterium]